MPLTIHHLGHAQSDRLVWLAEELEIAYELKKYTRSPVLAPAEFKALHPIGAAPVIEDTPPASGSKPIVLAETQACVEYMCAVHGGGRLLVRAGADNYADYLYWLNFTNGTLQSAIGRVMAMRFAGLEEGNATVVRYTEKVYQCFRLLEERLAGVEWLAGGELTAADIMIIFALTTLREFCPLDLTPYPHILAYISKIVKRPAYRRYLEKGDPDIDIEKFIQGPPPPVFPALAAHK